MAFIVLGIRVFSLKFIEFNKNDNDFVVNVEHVLFHFNENQDDDFAYKFLRIRRSLREVNSLLPALCPHSFQHLTGLRSSGFVVS